MGRGRPALRIGQHGKITRTPVSPGVWDAACYFRGSDGKRRLAQKRTPRGAKDRHGAAAEAALVDHLAQLVSAAREADDLTVTNQTLVSSLLERHLDALGAAGRAPRTIYSYTLRIRYWNAVAGGITVSDCTPGRLERLLEQVRVAHGDTDAKQLRTNLAAALDVAVTHGVLQTNPARATKPLPKRRTPRGRGATPIPIDALPEVVEAVLRSEKCQEKDLTDPILMHLATGLRVSEVLGLLWAEFNPDTRTIAVSGRVVWVPRQGLLRTSTLESSKATAPALALPQFAVDMLLIRAKQERPNLHDLIFPSTVGTLRDPSGFARQWRAVRGELGEHLSAVSGHSFRKTLSNLVTDHTADPRIAADVLGHSDIQTTMKHYLSRGNLHPQVATMVDNAVHGAAQSQSATTATVQ